jgi:hypothetical protein
MSELYFFQPRKLAGTHYIEIFVKSHLEQTSTTFITTFTVISSWIPLAAPVTETCDLCCTFEQKTHALVVKSGLNCFM